MCLPSTKQMFVLLDATQKLTRPTFLGLVNEMVVISKETFEGSDRYVFSPKPLIQLIQELVEDGYLEDAEGYGLTKRGREEWANAKGFVEQIRVLDRKLDA